MTVRPIFHLVRPDEWAAAMPNDLYRPPSLDTEGFVHFSFAEQVSASANRFYADEPALVAVEVEVDLLDVRVEDTHGHGAAFPHVYGPVPMSAVVATHPLERGVDGTWTFTPGDADAAASRDH